MSETGTAPAEPPTAYIRWYCVDENNPLPGEIARAWHIALPGDRRFWAEIDALETERDQLRARCDDYPELAADRDRLRELLDEIGVKAANADEDGDSFGVLEEITMMIAAHGIPVDDGRHPDSCDCQFCREDEREERDREELDDDTDNAIPDTERGGW